MPDVSPLDLAASVEAERKYGSGRKAARALGIAYSTHKSRLDIAARRSQPTRNVTGRDVEDELTDGTILVGSDAHFWPGEPNTAYRAFLRFAKRSKHYAVVLNGDVLDACSISRFPPIGWNYQPSVKQEIEVAQDRLHEIAKAAGKAKRYWPLGNHDARFERKLAELVPEYKDVLGISLQDHFPEWLPCWSVFIGGVGGVVIKHRFKGGMHAARNNTLYAGRSMITGHLHSLKVSPFSDYNGVRYGVDCGCLADPYHPAFQNYTEDNPKDWRAGFVLLTFKNGRLLWPEVIHVVADGVVEFRGELIHV